LEGPFARAADLTCGADVKLLLPV